MPSDTSRLRAASRRADSITVTSAPKRRYHLRELQPDVAAADDHQVLGHCVQRHDRRVVERRTSSMPGSAGRTERPPTLMKITRCGPACGRPTWTVRGATKRASPTITSVFASPRIHASTPSRDLRTMPSLRAFTRAMSTRMSPAIEAELCAAAREVNRARAGHQRLGRHAADVDAGAAEGAAFDDDAAQTFPAAARGQRRAGLAGADDDGINASACIGTKLLGAPNIAQTTGVDHDGLRFALSSVFRRPCIARPRAPV